VITEISMLPLMLGIAAKRRLDTEEADILTVGWLILTTRISNLRARRQLCGGNRVGKYLL
jgi:hypothetical protein